MAAIPTPISDSEENTIVSLLKSLNISAQTFQHDLALTVEEQAVIVGGLNGTLTKNLFLRDKKHGLFLVTAKSTRDVNMKTVGTLTIW